jgi:hypothetical protein
MDSFNDRRDNSEAGRKRRARFGELVESLAAKGLEREVARNELLKILHGEKSTMLRARPLAGG